MSATPGSGAYLTRLLITDSTLPSPASSNGLRHALKLRPLLPSCRFFSLSGGQRTRLAGLCASPCLARSSTWRGWAGSRAIGLSQSTPPKSGESSQVYPIVTEEPCEPGKRVCFSSNATRNRKVRSLKGSRRRDLRHTNCGCVQYSPIRALYHRSPCAAHESRATSDSNGYAPSASWCHDISLCPAVTRSCERRRATSCSSLLHSSWKPG
jgi:hypothetical protein